MWLDKLEYRDNLGIDKNVTFGIEIEFAEARRSYIANVLNEAYNEKTISSPWKLEYEETIFEGTDNSYTKGGEAISDILTDNNNTWHDIKYACEKIELFNGIINNKCGAHVHIGANVLKDNVQYYARLMKLWVVYEDVILRFFYGETNKARPNLWYYAASPYTLFKLLLDNFYYNDKLNLTFEQFVRGCNNTIGNKNLALSFRGLDEEFLKRKYKDTEDWYNYRTIECRVGNGTIKPIIWQNYVNLITKLFLCCLDDTKDWDMIDKNVAIALESETIKKYNYDKAIEFCNFIFDNDLDKYNFMVQYIKDKNYDVVKPKIKKKTI